MKKSYTIFILFLGIFFIPSNSFGCGSEKHTCEKKVSSNKTKEKSCCDNDNDNKGCEGSCGHSKCGCASTCIGSSTSILLSFKSNSVFNFSTKTKVKFYYTTPSLLDGYSSIWLIPKIS